MGEGYGTVGFEQLVGDLNSPAWEIRRDSEASPCLTRALQDQVGAVRAAAANSLGRLGGEEVVRPLLQCLDQANFASPGTVIEALGNIRTREAIPYFIRFLRDYDAHVRGVANTSLMVTTGKSMGFRATASDEAREKAAVKWESWWEENKDTFAVPGKGLAR